MEERKRRMSEKTDPRNSKGRNQQARGNQALGSGRSMQGSIEQPKGDGAQGCLTPYLP